MSGKPFFITTPIYYVNAEPHLGHAYSTIVVDVMARYHRLEGRDVFFLTGTDEHGDKILEAARETGETPREFVDRVSGMFRATWPTLNIDYNRFIRTTDPDHMDTVQRILQLVYDKGDIYYGDYGGYYCQGCERFVLERELVDGKCPDHGVEPKWIAEHNYFFRMSNYQDWLIDHIKANPDFIRPERYRNEVLSFLKEPLEDLCISRPASRVPWGITLPFDEKYVTYVWFDALINYVTATGWPDGDLYASHWPQAWHLIAKDILKPHGIYWPTMLKAAGIPVYQHLNVHGYWNFGGDKMSKSRGNVVKPLDLAAKYGPEAFRYFVMREMSFGLDASFSEEALVARLNGDLANDLGNLFSRVTAMIHKYNEGVVPRGLPAGPDERGLIDLGVETVALYREQMSRLQVHKALKHVWEYVSALNKYIDDNAPWALAKDKSRKTELDRVLRNLVFGLIRCAYLIWPVMPATGEEMIRRLGEEFTLWPDGLDEILTSTIEPAGKPVKKGKALFPRVETEADKAAKAKKQAKADRKAKPEPEKQEAVAADGFIDYDDFTRVHQRVGRIVKCEKPAKSKKLLQCTVDLGEGEPRTILTGLAEHYTPEEMEGRLVVVVTNLRPRKMMGIPSQGMILSTDAGDDIRLIDPPEGAAPGAVVR